MNFNYITMKSILIILCLLVALGAASCKKFLEQDPYSSATDETTWKTEGDANASVAACYSLMRSAFNAAITYYTYGDLISDEFTDIIAGDGAYRDIINMNWGIGIPSANTYDPRMKLRLYTNFYTSIAQSNRCLYYIGQMPLKVFTGDNEAARQVTKNKYLGEAYFVRAFNYYYMSKIWGDVPITTTYSDSAVTQPLSRQSQALVTKQALADADMAIAYLNWKDPGSADAAVRADKGAAFALKAHIYAWMGDYDKCNAACDSVIGSHSYNLTDAASFMSIYKGQSVESIFELVQNSSQESMIATDNYSITGVTLTQPYINVSDVQPRWQLSIGLIDYLYADTNDVRFTKSIVKKYTGSADVYECIKYANIQNVNNSTSYQAAQNNIIIFRYADIQLLKAEALAAKSVPDEAGALAIVNNLRAMRGVSGSLSGLSGHDLYYAIIDERGRELFLEGHRTFDLIRLERLTGDQQFPYMTHSDFVAGKYYWPIDPTLFLTNANLKQTTFWAGRMK